VKHALTAAVVAIWLGMVARLVEKQTPPPALEATGLPAPEARLEPRQDDWFGVYQGGRKIGHGHRVTTRTESGYRFEDDTDLELAMLGVPQPLRTAVVADTDAAFALRSFRFTLVSPAATFTATGTSDGRRLEVRYGGEAEPLVIPLDHPIALSTTLRPRILAAHAAPGTRYTESILSPITLHEEAVIITVEGHETIDGEDALRITEEQQGLRAHAWLAADGSVLREEGMLGFVLKREPRAVALAGTETAAPLDVAVAARIPLDGTIANPRELAALALRVSGEAADRIPDDPPRQRRTGDVLRVVREAAPEAGAADAATDDPAAAAFAAPGPFIESDDPAIVARARAIVGSEHESAAKARRIIRWVRENLTQEPSLTVPSAREVLRARRGDCNEHAVLVAALARAAGIPARVVTGAVYAGDGFYYHAWDELWLGRWVSADAVFAQLPVDATHVKLAGGGPDEQLGVAAVVGRLAFATVERGS
jgi:hypothetical protein